MNRTQTAQLAKEIEANRPAPEWSDVPELKKFKHTITLRGDKKTLTFDQLVTRYKDLDAEISYREKLKDELKEALQAAVIISEEDRVTCEGYMIQMVKRSGSKKIVPEKLLEQGVSADVIARATEVGKESQYISIRAVKEP